MSANIDFQNTLFQSIDTIVSARIANLPYDQTVECDIISNTNADKGEYTVQYQTAKFNAYSENKTFEVGDRVYVQILRGDFNQDKIIISKKQDETIAMVSKLPFNSFARQLFYTLKDEQSLAFVKDNQKKILIQKKWLSSDYQAGYSYLGIKFSINCTINDIILSGNYGLQIDILGFDQSQTTRKSYQDNHSIIKSFYFKTEDMIGASPFNTLGYINQSKIFNIKNLTISGINVYFIQQGSIVGETKGVITNSRVYLTNIQLYFGYNVNEFKSPVQVFLYTPDGLQYNNDYKDKTIYFRFLELLDDNSITAPKNILNCDIFLGHYDQNSSDRHEELGWQQGYIIDQQINSLNNNKLNVTLSSNRSLLSENYIITIIDKSFNNKYISNTLKFNNALYLEGSELLDILSGFQVDVAQEGYNGIYNIYGQDYLAIDPTAIALPHYFILNYYPTSNDVAGIQPGDIVSWKIPIDRSMIRNDIIYEDSSISQGVDHVNNMKVYSKTLTQEDIINGVYKIPYYIENYYSSDHTNNTIKFTLMRNGIVYNASKELLFGSAGSQGNEYNIIIRLQKDGKDVTAITAGERHNYIIQVDIYNYNNKKIENNNNITFEYDYSLCAGDIFDNNNNSEPNQFTVKALDINQIYYLVVKVLVTIGERKLEAYKPIAIRENDNYTAINGSTVITYDITGKKPLYNKLQFEISNNEQLESNVEWSLESISGETTNFKFNDNELIPPSVYHPDQEQINLICKKNQQIIWKQPIYIIQNKYPGAMINGEGNPSQLSNNDTAIQPMFGWQKDDGNNISHSGIYMGKIHEEERNRDLFGLYAYYQNKKIFLISEEGSIYINGNAHGANPNPYLAKIENTELNNIKIDGVIFSPNSFIPNTANYAISAAEANTSIAATNYITTTEQKNINTEFINVNNRIDNVNNNINAINAQITEILGRLQRLNP